MDSLPRSQPVLHPLGAVGAVLDESPGLGDAEGVWGRVLMRAQGEGDKKGSGVRESDGRWGNRGGNGPQCRGGELGLEAKGSCPPGAFFVT